MKKKRYIVIIENTDRELWTRTDDNRIIETFESKSDAAEYIEKFRDNSRYLRFRIILYD